MCPLRLSCVTGTSQRREKMPDVNVTPSLGNRGVFQPGLSVCQVFVQGSHLAEVDLSSKSSQKFYSAVSRYPIKIVNVTHIYIIIKFSLFLYFIFYIFFFLFFIYVLSLNSKRVWRRDNTPHEFSSSLSLSSFHTFYAVGSITLLDPGSSSRLAGGRQQEPRAS